MKTHPVFLCRGCNRTRRRAEDGELSCLRCLDDAERLRAVAKIAAEVYPTLSDKFPSIVFARLLKAQLIAAGVQKRTAERHAALLGKLDELIEREERKGFQSKYG